MIKWFFEDIPEFRPEVGFQTEFSVNSGHRDFHHRWTLAEAIPSQKIVYDWRYKDLPGAGTVTFVYVFVPRLQRPFRLLPATFIGR